MHDNEDARQLFKLMEYLHKNNPLSYNLQSLTRMFLYGSFDVLKRMDVPLSDLVTLSKTMLPSMFSPSIFFKDMLRTNYSFKTDVPSETTYELLNEICHRVKETQIEFEHLKLSSSKKHKNYQPFTELTFLLLQRILKDLV